MDMQKFKETRAFIDNYEKSCKNNKLKLFVFNLIQERDGTDIFIIKREIEEFEQIIGG